MIASLVLVGGTALVLSALAFILARTIHRALPGLPRAIVLVTSALAIPATLLIVGVAAFAESDFGDWIASRDPSAWANAAAILAASFLAAWAALRSKPRPVDLSVFD